MPDRHAAEVGDMPDRHVTEGVGMSGGGAERAAALERRYRRLLRCYPPSHREAHREEMLGVLLAVARSGQRTPDLWPTLNLVACGLAIRGRRAISWLAAGEPWQDALAVVSVIAPVLMLIVSALDFAVAVQGSVAINQDFTGPGTAAAPFWQQLSFVPQVGGPAAVMIAWLAVVVLGLTGRRRTAAAIACIPLALELLSLQDEVQHLSGARSEGLPLFLFTAGIVTPVAMASLAACSLAFSAGPRRGLAIVGRRRACLMIVGLSAGFGFPPILQLVTSAGSTFSLLGVLAIAVAVVVTRIRTTVDRRVLVLVAAALLLDLANAFPTADLTASLVFLLGSLLFVVLVWLVAIASWRGRIARASRAG
jgi:hypothetical protein